MKKIKNAIIIHGPGRSGTTLLSNILSLHKDFFWISSYVNMYPKYPFLTILNNLQSISKFEEFNRGMKKFPRPTEAYGFWKYYFNEFNQHNGIPKASETKNVLRVLEKIKTFSIGNRLIMKITGNTRINFLDVIFDNPTILWIDRNPSSVVMSYFKQKWKYRSKIELFNEIPKIELLNEYTNRYKNINKEKNKLMKFDFQQLFYEDLVDNPTGFFTNLAKKINIDMDSSFLSKIKNWNIYKGSNKSYENQLTVQESKFLKSELYNISKSLGY